MPRSRRSAPASSSFSVPRSRSWSSASPATASAKHGIGVSSGTDALLVALMALDIGPGDEVLTSPYSFFATARRRRARSARVPSSATSSPTPSTSSPRPCRVHRPGSASSEGDVLINAATGGRMQGADAGAPVRADGRHAAADGARRALRPQGDRGRRAGDRLGVRRRRRAGSIGDIGCFSFFPSKNLGAFGDAGHVHRRTMPALAERLRVLRVHGGKPKYYHAVIGGNFRLDAAAGRGAAA